MGGLRVKSRLNEATSDILWVQSSDREKAWQSSLKAGPAALQSPLHILQQQQWSHQGGYAREGIATLGDPRSRGFGA